MRFLLIICLLLCSTLSSTANEEHPARAMFLKLMDLHKAMETEKVREGLQEMKERWPSISKEKLYQKLAGEVAVIGKDAGNLDVVRWFQSQASYDDARVTLLVFFEEWCPHCQDEMPKIQGLYDKFQGAGINVVGLTEVTQGATFTKVFAFIAERRITFPIAKTDESFMDRYAVTGVPAAVIVKEGKILWRGNPIAVNEAMIEKALQD